MKDYITSRERLSGLNKISLKDILCSIGFFIILFSCMLQISPGVNQ